MLGQLPRTLNVNGKSYNINSDYRNIFRILAAFKDDELKDAEKALVCLRRLYTDFRLIPGEDYEEAYRQAVRFIDYNAENVNPKKHPKTVDLEKDEHLLFPAVNKVAGQEIRLLPYLHWWTFVGYFQSIDKDDLYSYVILIRHKKATHEKLEKAERKFYEANKGIIDFMPARNSRQRVDDFFRAIYERTEGGEQ